MSHLIEKDGKYYQECEVVILATEGKQLKTKCTCEPTKGLFDLTEIIEHSHSCGLLEYNGKLYLNGDQVYLYITTSEEIKEGCYILSDDNKIHKILSIEGDKIIFKVPLINEAFLYKSECKKIIATTDSLRIFEMYTLTACLPKPSKEFIEAYIEAYNAGKPIPNVLVEVEMINHEEAGQPQFGGYDLPAKPQLKLKDNTIIIKDKEEKIYTEEEIIFGVRKMLASENIKFHYVREELPKFLEEAKKEIISFKTNLKK